MAEGDPKIPDAGQTKASTDATNSNTKAVEENAAAKAKQAAETERVAQAEKRFAEAGLFSSDAIVKSSKAIFASMMGFTSLGEKLDVASEFLKKFGAAAMAVGTPMGRAVISPVSESGEALRAFNADLADVNEALRKLVTTQNAAREAIVMTGGSLAEGDAAAAKYPQTLRNMSAMLSISTKDLHGMTAAMRQVPGAISEASGEMMGLGKLAGVMVQPTAILATTMRAFGMDASQSGEMGKRAYFEFGQEIPETLKQVGRMADASKQAGVDLGTAREQIEAASKGLAIFGTGSAAAASTWTTFMTSLKGSGVPIGQIGEMVTALTGSFANMRLETKAAIASFSGMGGGRTALGGALQMEVNMRTPGGMEKNMEAMTATLAKFGGGRIITLQEAAANPQLEAQFVVQRQMLGKLTNISNPEQQNRILETMQNVQRGGMSQVEGGKALQDVFEKGKDLQTQQITSIDKGFQLTQAAIGGAADKVITGFQKALTGGAAPEARERGAARGMSLAGRGLAARDQAQVVRGLDTTTDSMKELFKISENLFDVPKPEKPGAPAMDVAGMDINYLLKRQGLRAPGVGAESLPPEAKLARRPAYAAVPPAGGRTARRSPYENLTATAAARPAESPLFRVADVLQKSDSTKVKLMEQMLAALQQKAATEEMPLPTGEFVPKRPATPPAPEEVGGGGGGGSVITVKIIGDEEKVKKMVEEALSRKSLHAIGHTQ